ncbi:MAG: peptidylprolyl isomerase, partial [Candidatus Zixiibacteriota bacterium]
MRKLIIILLSLTFIFLACGKAEKEADIPKMEEEKPAVETKVETEEGMSVEEKMAMEPPVWGSIERAQNPVVVLETNHGAIELELYWKETPKTAESFLYLTNKGYYDNLIFHRIVPNFVIQA